MTANPEATEMLLQQGNLPTLHLLLLLLLLN